MNIKYLILILAIFPVWLGAQVSFKASANVKSVSLSDRLVVSFTVTNGRATSFQAPSFKGFSVLGREERNFTNTNGRATEMVYTKKYTLKPQRVGKQTIGAATAIVNGKKMKTRPLKVDVLPAGKKSVSKPSPSNIAEGMTLSAEVSDKEVVVGQEVVLDFKLYSDRQVALFKLDTLPQYPGFDIRELKLNDDWKREQVKGKSYQTKVLRRLALFPKETGALEIPATIMPVCLRTFFGNCAEAKEVTSKVVKVKVNPLPEENKPANFSGAVGKYTVKLIPGNTNVVAINEPYTLEMAINGFGNMATVQPPDLGLSPNDFKLYEPKASDEARTVGGKAYHIKKIEYVLLPQRAGRFAISPEFIYFDTESKDYVKLRPGTVQLQVTAANAASENMEGEDAIEEEYRLKNQDVLPIKTATTLRTRKPSFFGSTAFWGLLILPVLLFGGAIGYRQIQIKRGNIDVSLLKSQRAGKVAQERLSVAKSHLDSNKSREFYDEVFQSLWGYVGDKLGIPLSELSKENVREQLAAKGISSSHSERFLALLNTCEMALFAGMDNASDMGKTYQEAVGVIIGIEEGEGSPILI